MERPVSDMAGKAARVAVECCGKQPRYNEDALRADHLSRRLACRAAIFGGGSRHSLGDGGSQAEAGTPTRVATLKP
jgi:hypothetical protein